jgi:hypothetical protein
MVEKDKKPASPRENAGRFHENDAMKLEDVAEYFKCSESEIGNLRRKHKDFPQPRLRNPLRWLFSDILEWFKKQSVDPPVSGVPSVRIPLDTNWRPAIRRKNRESR